MDGELEAGGALATAALTAHALEPTTGAQNGDPHLGQCVRHCANCKAQITGAYCSACGQAAHVHRSLWHMFEEFLHGWLHFDTKSWRTLPLLLFRPGLLTRRYIDGERVRYVSPLALFLFCTFLMFFGLSFLNGPSTSSTETSVADRAAARVEMVSELEKAVREVSVQTAALAKATTDAERTAISSALREAEAEQKVAQSVLQVFDNTVSASKNSGPESKKVTEPTAQSKRNDFTVTTGNERIDSVINKARSNPELLSYKLKNTAYKYSFMLIPISLPFLWLMFFWRPGVAVYDHAIFSLYSLSFMSLFVVIVVALNKVTGSKSLTDTLMLYVPIHTFLQLRQTYGLTFGSTLWRLLVLMLVELVVFLLFLLMIVAITVN